jgi:predicted unusual protein kinase regulating ubiquinone biosynthesis (AarF/ABC1/UbiB family)
MSMQDDFVPEHYMRWLKDTQANVPPIFNGNEAAQYAAKILKDEQGLNFDDVFSEWEDEPLGGLQSHKQNENEC